MGRRALASFWGATLASVLLLGAIWDLKDGMRSGRLGPWEVGVLIVAGIGFGATFSLAARIAFVVGRIQRRRGQGAPGIDRRHAGRHPVVHAERGRSVLPSASGSGYPWAEGGTGR